MDRIKDLGSADGNRASHQILREQLFNEHLPAMIASLSRAIPASRPVLICLNDWQRAAQLIEALLDLLPPSARSRTTFCTYESDRKYLVPTPAGARPKDKVAAHHLIALCAEETRRFDLRPDEYRSTFAIFNFIDGQFSNPIVDGQFGDPGEITPYAKFAAECARDDKKLLWLQNHHDMVERLGAGRDQEKWSALIPAVGLLQKQLHPEMLLKGVCALVAVAQDTQQAGEALKILLPHIQHLAEAKKHDELSQVVSEVATLSDRSDAIADEIFALLRQAFGDGQGRTVAALLRATGSARQQTLLKLLDDAMSAQPRPLPPSLPAEDREQIVELLLDGLRLAGQREAEAAPSLDELLIFSFRKAGELGLDLWGRGGGAAAKARLGGEDEMDQAQRQLLHKLLPHLPADKYPAANTWLRLRKLEDSSVRGRELIDELEEIARNALRCDEAETFTAKALRLVAERLENISQRAEALGRMAASARGANSEEKYLSAYQECRAELDPQQIKSLRGRLAEAGAISIMVHELLVETLPWKQEESVGHFNLWLDSLRKSKESGSILDFARQELAIRLRQSSQTEEKLPLAEALLTCTRDKPSGKGAVALGEAIVLALALQPLDAPWNEIFPPLASALQTKAKGRFEIMQFLRYVRGESQKPNWRLMSFLSNHPVPRSVAALSHDERDEVERFCLDAFEQADITKQEEAKALVEFFSRLNERDPDALPEALAEAVRRLLGKRDPVTRVLAGMAFLRCGLDKSPAQTPWGAVLRAIVARFDKQAKRLFEEHLEGGFHHYDSQTAGRLRQLCDEAGLPAPRSAPPAKAAETGKSAQETKSAPADPEQHGAGILGQIGGTLRGWMGKSTERGKKEKEGK